DGTGRQQRPATRFRFVFPTTMVRPAPDNDTFATVAHTATFFPNGVMRMDRTTTFTQATTLRMVFEWMSSFSLTVPKVGRIGRGLIVIDEADTFVKVAAPATPTSATSTTGGTLAAGTYTYQVTALSEGGETTPSATVAQVTTGTTSTVTVNFVAVTGATGYRVYGRTTGRLVLLATLGPAATSWIDDGSAPAFGPAPPNVNRARLLGTASLASDAAISAYGYWAVWYDPVLNMCQANIYDRDAALTRTGVAAGVTRLSALAGSIQKNYLNLYWGASDRYTVPSGTVWPVTHWSYTYIPQDPENYHLEAALLASNLSELKIAYPAT
ncbi:MAG: hypothetical protein M3Q75_11665, partial [Gemmatimonadota bacterium]|nr:hypothetical protein [Gemmatimonadota bacterium]